MKKTLISTLLIFTAVFTLNAQDPFSYYIPKGAVTPLHNGNYQLNLSLGYGFGIDVNASFTFLEHFIVFATVTPHVVYSQKGALPYDIKIDPWRFAKNDLSTSGGFGYYTRINQFSIEALIGGGYNLVDNYWWFEGSDMTRYTETQYLTGFLQFNFGYQLKAVSFGLATRITTNQYKNLNTKLLAETYTITEEFEKFNSLSFIEPALFVEWNFWRQLSLNAQVGMAIPLNYVKADYVYTRISEGREEVNNFDYQFNEMVPFGRIGFNYKFSL